LTDLLDRPDSDAEVVAARRDLPRIGWAAEILARQEPPGTWAGPDLLYRPKYLSTNWMLLILADLGLSRDDPRIDRAARLWIRRFATDDGGFGGDGSHASHLCVVGNTARALLQFGYEDHPKVRSALEWLVAHQAKLGGWSCWGSGRNLDSWEGLSAFAAYPRRRWTSEMQSAVERGAEFFLSRELYRQGDPYAPWFRFHYPHHYYYDVLLGLDLLTRLGYGADPRLDFAVNHVRRRQRSDGRWTLDAVHPDVEGPIAAWWAAHPKERPTPFAIETVGAPSKILTATALRALRRVDAAREGG
jgi:hypothetical protein